MNPKKNFLFQWINFLFYFFNFCFVSERGSQDEIEIEERTTSIYRVKRRRNRRQRDHPEGIVSEI